MKLFSFRKGGIHPPEKKLTAGTAIIEVNLPRQVSVLLSQHIGAPAVPCVAKNDVVTRGQKIAFANGFVSAHIHTPISGKVSSIGKITRPDGTVADAITVTAEDSDHFSDLQMIGDAAPVRTDREIDVLTSHDLIDIIKDAGIVVLGGAAFPTHVKLTPPTGISFDTLIINGAECEPYLTCDDAIMRTQANDIIDGVYYLMKAAGVSRAVIGIENNKPEAIRAISSASHRHDGIEVAVCRTKYPQGSEKQLIKALTGKEIPSGTIPSASGIVVDNVATALAVYHAVKWGIPLIERVITVSGDKLQRPLNARVPVGTLLSQIVELAGGIPDDTGKIVIGGPMMGKAAITLDSPLVKGHSGIVFFDKDEAIRKEPCPCVRCARCVEVCPMGLEPYLLSLCGYHGEKELAVESNISDCIECGSCTWICPSSCPILDNIRLAKSLIKNSKK